MPEQLVQRCKARAVGTEVRSPSSWYRGAKPEQLVQKLRNAKPEYLVQRCKARAVGTEAAEVCNARAVGTEAEACKPRVAGTQAVECRARAVGREVEHCKARAVGTEAEVCNARAVLVQRPGIHLCRQTVHLFHDWNALYFVRMATPAKYFLPHEFNF